VPVTALLAILSSLMWGVSDFVGGLASRRIDAVRVAALSIPIGVLPLLVLVFLVPGSFSAVLVWIGLAAGVVGMGGIVLLYLVLAAGPMGVVSPLVAVVSAVLPVVVGLVRGERPSLWAFGGMALAIVAIVLVSMEPGHEDDSAHQKVRPRVIALSVVSGALIGVYVSLIGTAPEDSGVWSVLLARAVSAVLMVGFALHRFRAATFQRAALWPAVAVGTLDALANAVFRIAAQSGLLAVVSVLGSLYPASTVLLARFYLHERLRPVQQAGMVTALVAVILLALG
jgi:drug/metabolite transporter (DMT)-like permease